MPLTQIPIEHLLLAGAVLLFGSIFASKVSGRFGIPALIAFLFLGMLAGSEGIGRIYFEDAWLAQTIGSIALVFILFAGGLDTDWASLRPVLAAGMITSTVGVLMTAGIVGIFAVVILRFGVLEGLLLASIVSSTDFAAVFSILRSAGVNLRGRLEPLLELESGSNDPMAILLTVGFISAITNPGTTAGQFILTFLQQLILGAGLGYFLGRFMVRVINQIRLEYDGLYPVFMIAITLFIYSITATIGGNGFLAVYIAGLVLGNSDFIHKRSLIRFHDGLAWLMQIFMFLTLGLLVYPSQLVEFVGPGLLIASVLTFIARPLMVFILLSRSKFTLREKLMISWVGLRGAAPIILSTFPLLAGIPESRAIFNIIFFVVIVSVLFQGSTIVPVAKLLGVHSDVPVRRQKAPLEMVTQGSSISSDLAEVVIPPGAPIVGQKIVSLKLPAGILVILVGRDRQFFVPSGGTVLHENDTLLVLADKENRPYLDRLLTPVTPESET